MLYLTVGLVSSFFVSYDGIFEGFDNDEKNPTLRTGGTNQRLQRQDSAWQIELTAWLAHPNNKDASRRAKVALGFEILSRYRDALHIKLHQCNSEREDLQDQQPPGGGKGFSALLLSVTAPLPNQPGGKNAGSERRQWFPPDRQTEQPQSDTDVENFLLSSKTSDPPQPPPIGCLESHRGLEDLLRVKSAFDLQQMCTERSIPCRKLNRLRMAESILFHDATKASRASGRMPVPRSVGGQEETASLPQPGPWSATGTVRPGWKPETAGAGVCSPSWHAMMPRCALIALSAMLFSGSASSGGEPRSARALGCPDVWYVHAG